MDEVTTFTPNLARYEQFMDVVRYRLTTRAFRPDLPVPREHFERKPGCAACRRSVR